MHTDRLGLSPSREAASLEYAIPFNLSCKVTFHSLKIIRQLQHCIRVQRYQRIWSRSVERSPDVS